MATRDGRKTKSYHGDGFATIYTSTITIIICKDQTISEICCNAYHYTSSLINPTISTGFSLVKMIFKHYLYFILRFNVQINFYLMFF